MADIVTSRVFVDGERGITAAKLNDIVGSSVIQPAFYSAKPVSSTLIAGDKLLVLKGGTGAYAQSDFQNVIDSVSAGINSDAEIWSVRLRSFNSVGNPNFEVDQRNTFIGYNNPADGTMVQDRWTTRKVGTHTGIWNPTAAFVTIPGTSFNITRTFLRYTLSTQQAVLGTGDNLSFNQVIEGSQWRELSGDVTSVSLLVRSSVANLKFAFSLADSTGAVSLVKLCTIPTSNVWTLIALPSIPTPSGGTFNYLSGTISYYIRIGLACGTSIIAPAANTWQTGNFSGAPGMDNFASKPVNSTFDISFVQHEPGSVCSTFIDCPYTQNLDSCLRYFQKSLPYGTKPGTASTPGIVFYVGAGAGHPVMPIRFSKVMAKSPTITGYSHNTGVINMVRDNTAGADRATSAVIAPSDSGFSGFTVTGGATTLWQGGFEYTADSGW